MTSEVMNDVVIIGAGGFARETADVIDAINNASPTYNFLGYIVDPQYGQPGTLVNDKPILGGFDWLEQHTHVTVICAVGTPQDRWQLVKRAENLGLHFCSLIHPSAIVTRWMTIAEGSVITAGCVLSNRVTIGRHVHINPSATIGHDVEIADFVSIAPGVLISGNINIGQGAYVGTGAKCIEKKKIGAWSIIGAGCTVIQDVPANTTVVGTPGKVIRSREEGWYLETNN